MSTENKGVFFVFLCVIYFNLSTAEIICLCVSDHYRAPATTVIFDLFVIFDVQSTKKGYIRARLKQANQRQQ